MSMMRMKSSKGENVCEVMFVFGKQIESTTQQTSP